MALVFVVALVEAASWALLEFRWGGTEFVNICKAHALGMSLEMAQMDSGLNNAIHPYIGSIRRDRRGLMGHSVNEFGFASNWPTLHKRAADNVIIGITGGSVAEQFCLSDTLPAALKAFPGFRDKRIELVQMAIRGNKQPQQLMTLAYLLSLGAELDILINIDGFNEAALPAAENVPARVFTAYPRSWHTLYISAGDRDILRTIAAISQGRDRRHRWAEWIDRSPLKFSNTATLVWMIANADLASTLADQQRELRELMARNPDPVSSGPREEFATEGAMYARLVDLWSESSVQLERLCTANDIRYFHFLQPNQYLPGSKPMSDAERDDAIEELQRYREPIEKCYPLMIAEGDALRSRGVAFFDLTGLFAAHPEAIYRDDCCHYNQHGDELLAEAIARDVVATLNADDR